MINWPNSLIKDLAEGRCVIFLGSGISSNSKDSLGNRPPTWYGLLDKANDRVTDSRKKRDIKKCLKRYDYLMACELIKKAMTEDRFNEFLVEEFQAPGFLPADIHKHIFRLDAPIVITPNFDKIYDTYVSAEAKGTIPVYTYDRGDIIGSIRSGKRIVLKMHGTIDDPGTLIFSKKDYALARIKYAPFYKLIESLILTKTFLFLGAGLSDPDIQLLLENYCFQYRNSRKHFFVIHEKEYADDALSIYEETLNLSFLKYKWSIRTKSYKDFLDSVANLADLVEDERSKPKI